MVQWFIHQYLLVLSVYNMHSAFAFDDRKKSSRSHSLVACGNIFQSFSLIHSFINKDAIFTPPLSSVTGYFERKIATAKNLRWKIQERYEKKSMWNCNHCETITMFVVLGVYTYRLYRILNHILRKFGTISAAHNIPNQKISLQLITYHIFHILLILLLWF